VDGDVPVDDFPAFVGQRRDAGRRDLEEKGLVESKQLLAGVALRVLADYFYRREEVLHYYCYLNNTE
jgi:hypothetical protein